MGLFWVPMQPYLAILRESGDQSINNLLIIAPGSVVVTRNSFLRLAFGQNHDLFTPPSVLCHFSRNKSLGPGPGPRPWAHKGAQEQKYFLGPLMGPGPGPIRGPKKVEFQKFSE